jgi:molybdopterin-guanine dinucleotide biosynthesis protein A
MGGLAKASLPLAGETMAAHVVRRVRPQVGRLVLSVERVDPGLDALGLEQIPDAPPGGRGPLVGLMTVMRAIAARYDWLLLVPCDAPFVPVDLAERLLRSAAAAELPGAVVRYASELQPTFSLWNRSLLEALEDAVERQRMGGFKQFLERADLAVLEWPDSEVSPFFNVNDPADLEQAGRILAGHERLCAPC